MTALLTLEADLQAEHAKLAQQQAIVNECIAKCKAKFTEIKAQSISIEKRLYEVLRQNEVGLINSKLIGLSPLAAYSSLSHNSDLKRCASCANEVVWAFLPSDCEECKG